MNSIRNTLKEVFAPKLFNGMHKYNRVQFGQDALAGIIVGIVAIPLAIAFGISSGVGPTEGMVTAIIAGLIISVLGGSKVQIGGPTGAFIVIIYGIIQQYGLSGLMIATIMAGILLIVMGLTRMGSIIKFVPYPVIVGFTAGIAVTIFSTQMNDFFGLGLQNVPANFIDKWAFYVQHFSVNRWAVIVGCFSLAICIVMLIERSHKEGITIILSGVKSHVRHQLHNGGIEQLIVPENICENIHVALRRAEKLLEEIKQ